MSKPERNVHRETYNVTVNLEVLPTIEPGDKVLVTSDEPMSEDSMLRIKAELEKRLPGVEFVFLMGMKAMKFNKTEEEVPANA